MSLLPEYNHEPLVIGLEKGAHVATPEELEQYREVAEKIAMGERLPENTQAWPTVVLKLVSEDVPYVLQGTEVDVSMKKADPETGMGFGMVVLTNQSSPPRMGPGSYSKPQARSAKTGYPIRKVAIPVIVDDFRLSPFDTFVDDEGVWHRLTEKRFSEVMFRPTAFVGTEPRPAVRPNIADRTYTPPEMAFGFGARGGNTTMSRTAGMPTAVPASLLNRALEALPDAKGYIGRHCSWMNTPDTYASFIMPQKLEIIRRYTQREAPTGDDYADAARSIMPLNILRVRKMPDGTYITTEVTDGAYCPRQRVLEETQLLAEYTKRIPDLLAQLAAKGGDVVATMDHKERIPLILEDLGDDVQEIESDVEAAVAATNGEFHKGQVFTNVTTFDGKPTGCKVFTNGQVWGYQQKIFGKIMASSYTLKPGVPEPMEWGMFVYQKDGGPIEATTPFRVEVVNHQPDGCGSSPRRYMLVTTCEGEDGVVLCQEPGIGRIYSTTGATDVNLARHIGQAIYKVPEDYTFVSLGRQLTFRYSKDQLNTAIRAKIEAGVHVIPAHRTPPKDTDNASLVCIYVQDGTHILDGMVMEDIFGKERNDNLSHKDALFALVVLGLGIEGAQHVLRRCKESTRITVTNIQPVTPLHAKTAHYMVEMSELEEVCDKIRLDLHKVAAYIDDDKTVDSVLALNFVTPETLDIFLEAMPMLQSAESTLARMLLYSRVGLKEIPEMPLLNALKGINLVNETLEYLKSYGRPGMEQSTLRSEQAVGTGGTQ